MVGFWFLWLFLGEIFGGGLWGFFVCWGFLCFGVFFVILVFWGLFCCFVGFVLVFVCVCVLGGFFCLDFFLLVVSILFFLRDSIIILQL